MSGLSSERKELVQKQYVRIRNDGEGDGAAATFVLSLLTEEEKQGKPQIQSAAPYRGTKRTRESA